MVVYTGPQGNSIVSEFLVSPNAGGGYYNTIQDAINAANAAGGGVVYLKSGVFNENLTLFDGVYLSGINLYGAVINGIHTPPASGVLSFLNILFQSSIDVFSTASATTVAINLDNCNFNINGYMFDMASWTGSATINSCFDLAGSLNGISTNSASSFFINNCTLGNVIFTFENNLFVSITNSTINCVFHSNILASFIFNNSIFNAPVFVENGTNVANHCYFGAAILDIDIGTSSFSDCIFTHNFNSSNAANILAFNCSFQLSITLSSSASATIKNSDIGFFQLLNGVVATFQDCYILAPSLSSNGVVCNLYDCFFESDYTDSAIAQSTLYNCGFSPSSTITNGSANPFITSVKFVGSSGSGGFTSINVQTFSTVGTFTYTPSANLAFGIAEVQAGGGAGAPLIASTGGGGGGGGGGYARKNITAAAIGGSQSIVVGGAGGASSFGSIISATAGADAAIPGSFFYNGGPGGVGSGGDVNVTGSSGGSNFNNSTSQGASGGSSFLGGGGLGQSFGPTAGTAGGIYGGGGGGGATVGTSIGYSGAQGIVIITEYIL